MPSLPIASWLGQAIFLSATMTGAPSRLAEPVGGLLDDLQRLPHLVEPDPEAAVGVAGVPGLDVEVVVLVAGVGLGLAQVPGVAGASAAPGRSCRAPGSRRGRGGRRPRGGP